MWVENSETNTVGERREARRWKRGGSGVPTPMYSRYPPIVDRRERPGEPTSNAAAKTAFHHVKQ